MKTKTLTYTEYQNRINNLHTKEDIAAFAQELLAPALAARSSVAVQEDTEDEDAATETRTMQTQKGLLTRKKWSRRPEDQAIDIGPWYDVVNNETEAAVISLYAKGMTTRDIVNYLKRLHGVELSQPSISSITDKVFPLIKEWQVRPLASCYPVVYLDGLHFKVRDSGKITPKVAYIAMGVNVQGQKEVLGIWISSSEGAKFWMQVLNDIRNRGVDDILITCVDGLKGFPEAIKTIFPQSEVQICITHQIRHTIKFIPYKDMKRFCADLKTIYTAPTEQAGQHALKGVMDRWPQYHSYLKSWEIRWVDLAPFFDYPESIRRIMYTTNAIENLNRQFRKVTKTTTVFPHDDALIKLLWLAQADIAQTWTMPLRNWGEIMAQLSIMFPDRITF